MDQTHHDRFHSCHGRETLVLLTDMARVVLLVYHGAGHINPLLKPARVLEANHEVFFAGFAFFKDHVESQGFKFFPLHTVPFGLGFESWVNTVEKKTLVYWNALKDKWND